ncbi:hypothetical protein [Methanobacterium oryzae]
MRLRRENLVIGIILIIIGAFIGGLIGTALIIIGIVAAITSLI